MGFIGGAILQQGTATAASLWAIGAIGTAVGLGAYDSALVIAAFTILTLRLLAPSKRQGQGEQGPEDKP